MRGPTTTRPLAARLYWLPIVAGCAWFITLATLLIYWVAHGRPRLPGQLNPYVAFISDIGAFKLHWFFILGGFITGISFAGTVISVHSVRYHRRMYAIKDSKWKKALSVLASIFGVAASASLVLLTVFDTAYHHDSHQTFLLVTFSALALAAITTSVVWFDQTWRPSDFKGLRRWCLTSNGFVAVEAILGAAFFALGFTGHMRLAGIFEWIVTFVGCGYIFCFVGYLWVPFDEVLGDDQRQPLLSTTDSQHVEGH